MEIHIPLPVFSPAQWYACIYAILTGVWVFGVAMAERSGRDTIFNPITHITIWPFLLIYWTLIVIVGAPYCLIAGRAMPWDYKKEIKFYIANRTKIQDALNSYVKTLSRKPVDKVSIRYAACYPEIIVTAYKRRMHEITQIIEQCKYD